MENEEIIPARKKTSKVRNVSLIVCVTILVGFLVIVIPAALLVLIIVLLIFSLTYLLLSIGKTKDQKARFSVRTMIIAIFCTLMIVGSLFIWWLSAAFKYPM